MPDDETIDVIQERAQEELARHGYPRYEVSAYARADRRCRHNLNYWAFGDYLGIGAGAHGKLSDPAAGQIQRLWKVKHPRDYLARAGTPAGVGGDAPVREAELPLEFSDECLASGRRGAGGAVRRARRSAAGGAGTRLEPGTGSGLLENDPERLQSELGLRFLNDLLQAFIPETEPV